MTASSADTTGGNPLAGKVSIHEKPAYTVVKLTLGNQTDSHIQIEFHQSIPTANPQSCLDFSKKYHGRSWTIENDELQFQTTIDGKSTVKTLYAVKETTVETLQSHLQEATVSVSDADGNLLGRVHGLDPAIEERNRDSSRPVSHQQQQDGTTEADEQVSAGGNHSVDESEPETGLQESTSPTERTELSDIAQQPNGNVDAELTEIIHDESPVVGRTDQTNTDSKATASERQTGDNARASASTEQSSEGASSSSEQPGEAASSSSDDHTGSETRGETRPADEQANTADNLPATHADYILSDVRGKIESGDEFQWFTVEQPEKSTGKQILDRIRSIVGL